MSEMMKVCPRCGGGDLYIFKLFFTPNWWWCPNCDALYDDRLDYQGSKAELKRNSTLENIEENNIKKFHEIWRKPA